MLSNFVSFIATAALAIKSGIAPFHFWFPQVINCRDWPQCLILLTWQKLAPLALLSFFFNYLLYLIILSSALFGALGGINQFNTKILLTYSSILHSAWILSLTSVGNLFWLIYLLIYSLINFSILLPISTLNIAELNAIYFVKTPSSLKALTLINFLSLAGLPPFLGFAIKILTLIVLLNSNLSFVLIFTIIATSFVSFYFYLRFTFTALFNNFWLTNFIWTDYLLKSFLSKFIIVSFLANLLFPLIVIFN